jgi:hypothetical protein
MTTEFPSHSLVETDREQFDAALAAFSDEAPALRSPISEEEAVNSLSATMREWSDRYTAARMQSDDDDHDAIVGLAFELGTRTVGALNQLIDASATRAGLLTADRISAEISSAVPAPSAQIDTFEPDDELKAWIAAVTLDSGAARFAKGAEETSNAALKLIASCAGLVAVDRRA